MVPVRAGCADPGNPHERVVAPRRGPHDGWVIVRDAMSAMVLSVGPDHSLRSVAQKMASRKVGAAVVEDHEGEGVGILTERDILIAIAAGEDPDLETARAHLTPDIVYAAPEWTLEHAGQAMMRGGFRHLVVMEDGEVVGIVSMRDLVRVYLSSLDEG